MYVQPRFTKSYLLGPGSAHKPESFYLLPNLFPTGLKYTSISHSLSNKEFKHIHLFSIAKQVLATYINQFRVCFLEPASTDVI
jgi:hypothetical protein